MRRRLLVLLLAVALLVPAVALAAEYALPGGLRLLLLSETLTPTAIAAAACYGGVGVFCSTTQTFTVTGLATGSKVFLSPPAFGSSWPSAHQCPPIEADVSAVNTLRVRFAVLTSAACTPPAGTYQIFAIQ